jgi:TfoX/Sxy family transcriptional regulator of competence genes
MTGNTGNREGREGLSTPGRFRNTDATPMATRKDTIQFILQKLGHTNRFVTRPMFGEYALYADGGVVALVCDDLLYVKILPASDALAHLCERGHPYPGSSEYYLVEESQLTTLPNLPAILFAVAEAVKLGKKRPAPKKRKAA